MTIGVTPPGRAPQLRSVGGSGANPVHAASTARPLAALTAALYVLVLLPAVAVGTPADPLDGLIIREIRVIGLSDLPPAAVTRHLASKAGAPFRRANVAIDTRRLDELRLFSTVRVEPSLDGSDVVIDVKVKQTLRILPTIALRVTDANGLSAGAGMRSINLFGHGAQAGVSALFGGETAIGTAIDTTTITPGTWAVHTALNYTSRENTLYDYHERATFAELRPSRNFSHGIRLGGVASLLIDDTGTSDVSLSPDGTDVMPTFGTFVTLDTLDSSTNPRNGTWAEGEIDDAVGDARSWTFIADGRRFQRLSARHGVAAFALASFQTGEVGDTLPEYLQFALGGANTVRGWSLGSRTGRNQFIGTAEIHVRRQAGCAVFDFWIERLRWTAARRVCRYRTGVEPPCRPPVGDHRLRCRPAGARSVRRSRAHRRRLGRARRGGRRLFRHLSQGRAPAAACALSLGRAMGVMTAPGATRSARLALLAGLVLVAFLSGAGTAKAAGRNDIVVMINGDRITGSILSLTRGRLQLKTDNIGTIDIEWDKIATVESLIASPSSPSTDGGWSAACGRARREFCCSRETAAICHSN